MIPYNLRKPSTDKSNRVANQMFLGLLTDLRSLIRGWYEVVERRF